jgi:uncharacterized protein (TIGR03437 family)
VGSGALVLSSTDSFYCDLLVAIPAATSASTATLSGDYYLASMEILGGNFNSTRDTFFRATANGGSFGNVTIKGTAQNLNNQPASQTSTGATYTINANGTGTVTFPAPSGVAAGNILLSGAKQLFVSQDGSFFVAGGATSFDMVVGVKALTGSPSGVSNGLYFQGFVENLIDPQFGPTIYAGTGSANEIGSIPAEIGHQRIQADFNVPFAYDATYAVDSTTDANGVTSDSVSQFAVGAGGNFIIGAGNGTNYQLVVYTRTPPLTGTGVFLNPQGIVNAASFSPFTAGVSPGEFLSMFGTGLASQTVTASALPFPNTLGNVQVNVSYLDSTGKLQTAPAPIYTVSSGLISIVVPYSIPTDGSPLAFQVINNGTNSNTAVVYSGPSAPGIFTQNLSGLGDGAIRHSADNTVVTTANPAKVGEIVSVYLTGMGAVTPPVIAGTAAPSNPLSITPQPKVFIDGTEATVSYSGLAPGLAGLYQLNVKIPTGVTAGASVGVEVDSFDSMGDFLSFNIQATIPISK